MELGIAEQILTNYEDAKLIIRRSREAFLTSKTKRQAVWMKDEEKKIAEKSEAVAR